MLFPHLTTSKEVAVEKKGNGTSIVKEKLANKKKRKKKKEKKEKKVAKKRVTKRRRRIRKRKDTPSKLFYA